jgi:hypothetical protein
MTPREFSGWVPAEKHTHYAADGETVTGFTVVERESRIDDADRVELLALAEHDAQICRCGFHPLIAMDDSNTFTPETRTCPVCAAQAVWNRVLDEDDKVPHDAPARTPRPSDGRESYMRMLTPQQVATAKISPART